MTTMTVVRLYSVAFMCVAAVVAYLSFTQPLKTTDRPDEQQTLYANVPTAMPGPPPTATPVAPTEALAYLRVPRFGKDWLWVVSEGTAMDILNNGPGHFINTALPGDEGNTAYAGHRAGHGDPFLNFEMLREGDRIILAQNGAEWTYRVRFAPKIIDPNESWITQQVTRRGNEFAAPRLTLVTCWPKYGSQKRMYVRAVLEDTQ